MTRTSLAPELSATLSRVSCWTISLRGLLHDLEQTPALLPRQGPRLGDPHEVADAALVLLVVDLELGALLDGLAVQAVGLGRADLDDDRLVHLVGDDGAEADLAAAALFRRLSLLSLLSGGVAHSASSFLARRPRLGLGASSWASGSATATACGSGAGSLGAMPKSLSLRTVMIRARSWRTFLIWLEFSSCPTACLNRSS